MMVEELLGGSPLDRALPRYRKPLGDAQRGRAGIMEGPIGAEEKMEAIEQTERAKRKLMAQEAAAKVHK